MEVLLKALGVTSPACLLRRHGSYRVARVVRAAAAKGKRVAQPAAWVLAALARKWDLDEY